MRTRIMIMTVAMTATLGVTAAIALTAGDDDTPAADQPAGPAGGACLEGATDCADNPGIDVGEPDDTAADEFDSDGVRGQARDLLGSAEADLSPDVRIAQRGDETYALTEDYVLGRMTVTLERDGSGTFVVTSVVIELPDGPETITS